MRKPDNLINYEQLLKVDPDLKITTQGVIDWLEKFLPYTKNILTEIKKSGIKNYPSIIQEWTKYVRVLMDYEEKEHILVDNRIKEILTLEHNFFKNYNSEYLSEFKDIDGCIHKGMRNICILSSKTKVLNKLNKDDIGKSEQIIFHLDMYKDLVEGIVKPLLIPIIFYLNSGKIKISELNKLYFSCLFFKYKDTKIKVIESDFKILFENIDVSLRNANAHFDYDIDPKNEIIRYKTGSRKNPIITKLSFSDLKKQIIRASGIARQLAIAYELFWYELSKKLPELSYDFTFDENLTALNQNLLPKKYVLIKIEYSDKILSLFINNFSKDTVAESFVYLIGWIIGFMGLANSYESPVDKIKLILDNFAQVTINIEDMNKVKFNNTKENRKVFADMVFETLEMIS